MAFAGLFKTRKGKQSVSDVRDKSKHNLTSSKARRKHGHGKESVGQVGSSTVLGMSQTVTHVRTGSGVVGNPAPAPVGREVIRKVDIPATLERRRTDSRLEAADYENLKRDRLAAQKKAFALPNMYLDNHEGKSLGCRPILPGEWRDMEPTSMVELTTTEVALAQELGISPHTYAQQKLNAQKQPPLRKSPESQKFIPTTGEFWGGGKFSVSVDTESESYVVQLGNIVVKIPKDILLEAHHDNGQVFLETKVGRTKGRRGSLAEENDELRQLVQELETEVDDLRDQINE